MDQIKQLKDYCDEIVHKDYTDSAKRDLQRHLDAAKKNPKYYHFLDVPTAEIKIKKIE